MNKLQLNFFQNAKVSLHENANENVFCKMAAMFFSPQCAKFMPPPKKKNNKKKKKTFYVFVVLNCLFAH